MFDENNEFMHDNKYDKYPHIKDPIERILFFFADEGFDLENPKYNNSVRQVYEKLSWDYSSSFDIICSFWITFQSLLAVCFENEFKYDAGILEYKTAYGWRRIGKSALSSKFMDKKNVNCRPLLKKIPNECKELAMRTHSVANYMPCVSPAFNYVKGIHRQVCDYLPMMVDQIQKWKDDNQSALGNEIIYKYSIKGEAAPRTITVNMIKEWHQWLIDNCEGYSLSMYYSVIREGNNARIRGIPFFHEQSLNNPIPKSKEEIINCMINMNKCIYQRANELMSKVK